MNDLVEEKMIFIIYTLGVGFFIIRIVSMIEGDGYYDDPDNMKFFKMIQAIIELLITVSFIWVVIPKFFNKLKSTPIKKTVEVACMIGGMALVMVFIPEFTEKPWEEQRLYGMIVCMAVIVAIYIISYYWGKKHDKKNEEKNKELNGVENNENDD